MPPTPPGPATLLTLTAAAIAVLVLLIAWARVHAFIALVLVSLALGVAAGMPLTDIARAFQEGVGATLGFIAVVIGLGTILGKLLAESGGADVLAGRLMAPFGPARVHWALATVGFIVGLPIFFAVGLFLLGPLVFTIARTGLPVMFLAVPLVTGLSASHGLVPPHPGPLVAVERLGADMGLTILWGLVIGLPVALLVGPPLGRVLGRRLHVTPSALASQFAGGTPPGARPAFATALVTVLLPVLLMLGATGSALVLPPDSPARAWAGFVGSPIVAMLVAVIVAFRVFGTACGRSRAEILRSTEACLGPVASMLLVVGAGGGFGRVLDAAGVDQAIAGAAAGVRLSPLVLGWMVAALLRIAVGSATVTITTAASIIAPLADAVPGTSRELLVVAMGAGSLIASHVNDGGFWLVKEYFNLSVPQTLASWTVLETALAVAGLVGVLLLDVVV